MNPRLYRLTEIHQRIDSALHARSLRDPTELGRLIRMKLRVKRLIRRLALAKARA